jgi:hypothetical protein
MWRRTRQAVIDCFIFFGRCGRRTSSINTDFAEILENLDGEINNSSGFNNSKVNI